MVSVLPIVAALLFLASPSNAADWQVELVDQVGSARYSSLRVDKEGNVHVAYVVDDGNRYPLKYAFRDHALKRWFFMTVDEGASFCSLALDSKQRPHISYADYGTMSGSKLRYAHWDGTIWKKQAIPLNSDVIGYFTSIVLDPEDKPSISFYEYRGARDTDFKIRLRNVMWNGEYWQVQTIDPQEGSGKFNAMVADSQGHIHVAYANVSAGTAGLRYAYWNGKAWSAQIVEGFEQTNGDYVGANACIALDKEGNPHISYMNSSTAFVKYAVRKNGHWDIRVVDRLSRVGYPDRNSIALDDQGRPYISYYDAGRGVLKVAHQSGQQWVVEIVDRNFSGITSSLQIDRGTIWISYGDEANRGLKMARWDATTPNTSAATKPVQSSQRRSAGPEKDQP